MKKGLLFFSMTVLLLFIAACGDKEEKHDNDANEIDPTIPLKVDLHVPEKGDKDEPIGLKATVTQDEKPVKDASDVQYEIWTEGAKDDSDMVEAINEDDGSYTTDYTFKKDGLYTVQVHVTAREQHQMPAKKITIGDAKVQSTVPKRNDSGHHHNHGGHHHAGSVSMHFMKPAHMKKAQSADLIVHLENDSKPLEKAEVRYEVWQEGQKKHDWVNAKELKPGEYEAKHVFKKSGTYKIQVHVENDQGLHEHEEHKLTVE